MHETPFEVLKARVDRAQRRLKQSEDDIVKTAEEACHWLGRNFQHYSAHGARTQGAWWKKLPSTGNEIIIDLRDYIFRCHLYDTGLRYMMDLLMSAGIIEIEESLDHIEFAVGHESMALHHELMGYRASQKNTPLGLNDVAERFGYGNPVRLRDRRLGSMAELGMWFCQMDRTSHSISIGIVAEHFHTKAFIKIKNKFDPRSGAFPL